MIRVFCLTCMTAAVCAAQTAGAAGTVEVTVADPSGAAIPGATVVLEYRVTGFQRTATADQTGVARITGVPFNPYHVSISSPGFQKAQQDVMVRTALPIQMRVTMVLAEAATSVEVHGENSELIESVPTAHTDVDRDLFSKLPKTSAAAGLSEVLTNSVPGIAADSDGFVHPQGDHAETGFSIDNQPVTDQQSKKFSNSLPLNAFGSFEVISGAPPAEYGDKAALVVNAITRSGLGQTPFGNISFSYGSFGSMSENLAFGLGGSKWGNFFVGNVARSGRYLDTPEFRPFHDIGNNQQIFDRIDFAPTTQDTFHLNLFLARSWFQIPNTLDQVDASQDQRQRIRNYNIALGWTHLFNSAVALSVNPYFRQDHIDYYPSNDPLNDQPATVSQYRRLSNLGLRADLSYVKGIHNLKTGIQLSHNFLHEHLGLGITNPTFNPVCFAQDDEPVLTPTVTDPRQCQAAGYRPNPDVQPGLIPFDLTRNGRLFQYAGRTDIKQAAFFLQDSITLHGLTLQLGLRGDIYRGLSSAEGVEPRLGISYLLKRTATVLRFSYSRFFETPYNENVILSSATGAGGLANNVFGAYGVKPLTPGRRNQYNVGFQQGIGKRVVIDADYFWKFTQNAFDFDNLFSTPIAFPIEWRRSKIDGLAVRVNFTPIHGFSAYTVMGHTRARFFGPENGGLIFNTPIDASVFRIDHDQQFQQTTHVRYQRGKDREWIALTWRFDSGLVASRITDPHDAFELTANEQAAIGLYCGSRVATPANPIEGCPPGQPFGSSLLDIPRAGTFNADTNPGRVKPRNLFDLAVGTDNLLHGKERCKWTLQLSASNLTNKVALYNFLSTFSGTHFVSPRSYKAELGLSF